MTFQEPWSKKHKAVTRGTPFSLSNSFVEPLTNEELIQRSLARGDHEIVEDFHKHSLAYTPNGGSLDLRQQIAGFYGPQITADNVVVFAGGQVALQTAAFALLDSDSHTIVFTPGYQSVVQAPVHAGSSVTEVPLRPENNWQIDPAAVAAAVREDTRYMVINEPYNPAGTLMDHRLQQELKDIAERNNIHLMSDEVYRLLEHDANSQLPAMADLYDKGISACTMSKPWGGCGISIGWLAFQDQKLRQKLIDVQYFGTACPSRASEIQALMTLRDSESIIHDRLQILRRNLALLDEFFESYGELFEWVRPQAGAIAFVKFKGALSAVELGDKLAQAGISIKPAYVFTGNTSSHKQFFRIGFGEAAMPNALEALVKFIKKNLL